MEPTEPMVPSPDPATPGTSSTDAAPAAAPAAGDAATLEAAEAAAAAEAAVEAGGEAVTPQPIVSPEAGPSRPPEADTATAPGEPGAADPTAPATPATADATTGAAAVTVDLEAEERRRRRRLTVVLVLLLILITLLTIVSAWYLIYRRPLTDLLPPTGQNQPPHYLQSIYDATKPVAVAVSGAGDRVYVVQTAGDRQVAIFDGSGKELGDLQPPSDNKAHTPAYVTVDPRDGDVYVSDRATGAVYVYSSNGSYLREFTPKVPIPGWQPLGVSLSPTGSWWITDLSEPFHRIEVFTQDGTLVQTIGSKGEFSFPNMIAFDTAGNAYVTDSNNGRLVVIDPTGQEIATVGRGSAPGNLGLPRGVATDDTGRLYVVDATGQFVHLYRVGTSADWRPTFLDEFGSQGIGDGQFNFPNGIAVDSRYRVYVTDRENDRVQVWGY